MLILRDAFRALEVQRVYMFFKLSSYRQCGVLFVSFEDVMIRLPYILRPMLCTDYLSDDGQSGDRVFIKINTRTKKSGILKYNRK